MSQFNGSVADLIASVSKEVSSSGSAPSVDSSSDMDLSPQTEGSEGQVEDGAQFAQAESSPAEGQNQEAPAEVVDWVSVTDDTGRKKIKVDWNNKDQIKKQIELAYGARKWQAERDKLQRELKNIQPEYQDLKQSWGAIEQAFKSDGIKGLVNLLEGRQDAYDSWIAGQIQRANLRATASESELRQMDLEERLNREAMERKKAQEELENYRKSLSQEKEVAEQKKLEATIHPAFNKHRFAGSLGDEVLETQLDQAVWTQALSRLESLPEDTELTNSLVEKVFSETASTFRKAINSQANKQVKAVVQGRKDAAQAKVSASTVSAMTRGASNAEADAASKIKSGNLVDVIKGALSGKRMF